MYDSYFLVLGGIGLKICTLKEHNNISNYLLNNYTNGYIIKKSFSLLTLIVKVIIACVYAFSLGYRLFFTGDNFLKLGLKFLFVLIITYLFIGFPYSFFKASLLPNAFNKNIVELKINPFNMHIYISSNKPIKRNRVLISLILPSLIFIIIPNMINLISEFNIFLYAITSAGSIIACEDLLFSILLIKNDILGEDIIITPFEYINSNINLSGLEVSVELREDLNAKDKEYNDEFCYQLLENIDNTETRKEFKVTNKKTSFVEEVIFNTDNTKK